jgi:hypothetical protein
VQAFEGAVILAALAGTLAGYSQASGIVYDWSVAWWAMAMYAAVWVAALTWSGGYDRPWNRLALAKGVLLGAVILLAAYALLPNELRFSRALLLLGTVEAFAIVQGVRTVFFRRSFAKRRAHRKLVVASPAEQRAILDMTKGLLGPDAGEGACIGLHPEPQQADVPGFVGDAGDLPEAMRVHKVEEVIFSGRELSAARIIDLMSAAAGLEAKFRIAWTDDSNLIGAGGPVTDPLTDLARSLNRRQAQRAKRSFDVLLALGLLVLSPVPLVLGRFDLLSGALRVLAGGRTWVGYAGPAEGLPALRKSLFPRTWSGDARVVRRMDLAYARDYRMRTDLMVIREALILRRAIHRHGNN